MNKKLPGIILLGILAFAIIAAACTPKSNVLDNSKIKEGDLSDLTQTADFEVDSYQQTFTETETLSNTEQHTVEFNNEIILFTAFHSAINDWEYSVDKVVFTYDGAEHNIFLNGIVFGDARSYNIIADDYNFDGFMDVNISNSMLWENSTDYIYLYNAQTKSYSLNSELSGAGSIEANSETQTIRQTILRLSTAIEDNTVKYWEYIWENGELKLIRNENIEYDESMKMHIRTIQTLQNDGTWLEEKERAEPLTP